MRGALLKTLREQNEILKSKVPEVAVRSPSGQEGCVKLKNGRPFKLQVGYHEIRQFVAGADANFPHRTFYLDVRGLWLGVTLRAGPRTSTRHDRVCRGTRPTNTIRHKRTRCDSSSPASAEDREGAGTLLGRKTRRESHNSLACSPSRVSPRPGIYIFDFLFYL